MILQAEHERVQSCLFDLKESREAASNASAAADDFERQLEETLTQQVRWVPASAQLTSFPALPVCIHTPFDRAVMPGYRAVLDAQHFFTCHQLMSQWGSAVFSWRALPHMKNVFMSCGQPVTTGD